MQEELNNTERSKLKKGLKMAWLEVEAYYEEIEKLSLDDTPAEEDREKYIITLIANMIIAIYRLKNGRLLE